MSRMIIQNEAKCVMCEEIVFSRHRHDYKTCSCGEVSVDGGMDYIRRGGSLFEERSLFMEEGVVERGTDAIINYPGNELGKFLAVVRVLRDAGLLKEKKMKSRK